VSVNLKTVAVTIGAPEGPARAIAVVRQNLDYLERLLNGPG
jgi:hypothetical protein